MSIRVLRRLGAAFLAAAAFVQCASSSSHAQLYTADPYDPPGRGFRQYAYPGADEGYPGSYAARARIVRPNQFERADDDLGISTGRVGRPGRYSDTDRLYGRDPAPSDKADRKYFTERDRREQAMLDATRESDPKKRDRMVREAEKQGRRAASDVSLSVRRSAPAGGAAIPPAPLRASANAANRGARPSASSIPPAPTRRVPTAAGSTGETRTAAPRRSGGASASANRSIIPPPPSTSRSRERDDVNPLPSDVLERARERDRSRAVSTRRLP